MGELLMYSRVTTKKTGRRKMAAYSRPQLFGRNSGLTCHHFGSKNLLPCHFDPSGFEYFDNMFLFRLRKLLLQSLSLPLPSVFPSHISTSQFQEPWGNSDVSGLAEAAEIFSSRIQLCFPDVVIPKFPTIIHPSLLIHFLSSLLSCFHNYLSSIPHIPYPHSHELPYILDSLRKLVVFAQAQSACPIVSLSLPPCPSVPSFVTQVTFLAHLFPLSISSRAKASVFATSTIPADAQPVTSGEEVLSQVSVGRVASAAKVRRAPGDAWAAAWARRRPAQGVVAANSDADAGVLLMLPQLPLVFLAMLLVRLLVPVRVLVTMLLIVMLLVLLTVPVLTLMRPRCVLRLCLCLLWAPGFVQRHQSGPLLRTGGCSACWCWC
jgi:hypothetical protein